MEYRWSIVLLVFWTQNFVVPSLFAVPKPKPFYTYIYDANNQLQKTKGEIIHTPQEATLVNYLKYHVDHGTGSGAAVGIIGSGGKKIYVYGWSSKSSKQPIVPWSVYQIGSLSKTYTGVILNQMVRGGFLSLDDPVRHYLPHSPFPRGPNGEEITFRHLADHKSGLPRLPTNLWFGADLFVRHLEKIKKTKKIPQKIMSGLIVAGTSPMAARWGRDPYKRYHAKQLHRFLARYQLQRSPGTTYEYSNLGYGILGWVLPQVYSQKTGIRQIGYEDLLKQYVTEPLKLEQTTSTLHQSQLFVQPYNRMKMPVIPWSFDVLAGAGSIQSSMVDQMRYLEWNIQNPLRTSENLSWGRLPNGYAHNGMVAGHYSLMGANSHMGIIVLTNNLK